jgi:hypothetical protein
MESSGDLSHLARLVTVFSGQRPMDFYNLQAYMAYRRPSCFIAVGSGLFSPSGFIPSGVEVGCGELVGGGFGVVLDHVSRKPTEDLSAKCR